jgi:HD-like signal output (HDOD) protein
MKRILLVDDEPKILDGLRRLLRPKRLEWDMSFAEGGEAALALLDQSPFDVIVSDMKMPGMDGATLLERVRERHPHVVRIVLSGHTELEAAFRAARVAHQFLLKPCDANMLQMAIERACSLQSILSSEALAGIVGALGELPSAPRVYTALTQALADPDSSLERIAGIVEQDVAISAKILQLVNSAFFGLARNVSSVGQAVSYLGVNILQSLVMSVETVRTFTGGDQVEGFSIDEFEEHSQLTAGIARKLGLPRHLAEPAVVASLLHDVGKLVLATRAPQRLRAALRAAEDNEQLLHQAETDLYGVTHAEVGAYLLGLWALPQPVAEAVAHHHSPSRVPRQQFDVVAAVYVADMLAHQVRPHSVPCEPMDEAFLKSLGVADRYPAWLEAAQQLSSHASEVSHAGR